jgi:hypothetical protein
MEAKGSRGNREAAEAAARYERTLCAGRCRAWLARADSAATHDSDEILKKG